MKNCLQFTFIILFTRVAFGANQCRPVEFGIDSLTQLSGNLEPSMVLRPRDAADIVMNTFYQSCNAADKAPYDIFERGEMQGYKLLKHPWNGGSASSIVNMVLAKASQYYIECPQEERKSCINLCQEPPTYIWGGKGIYNGSEIDLGRNEGSIQRLAQHPGIDCSGFVNAAFATAGLKVRPGMTPSEVAFNTPARWFMKPSQCFEQVAVNEPFKPGDVISWRKHLVMVDNCSADPFKLRDITNINQCTSTHLNPLEFELIISNSVGGVNDVNKDGRFTADDLYGDQDVKNVDVPITGVGIGVSKMPFGDLALKYPTEIMELAKAACYAKFNTSFPLKKINVTRHVLADREPMPSRHACLEDMENRATLKGLECLQENCKI